MSFDPTTFRCAVIGMGVVGSAFAELLHRRLGNPVVKIDVDPSRGEARPPKDLDMAFVCVPTPSATVDTAPLVRPYHYNLGSIFSALCNLQDVGFKGHVFIRSTITPKDYEYIQTFRLWPFLIHTFPEFLTEANAMEDTMHPRCVFLGLQPDVFEEFDPSKGVHEGWRGSDAVLMVSTLCPHNTVRTVDARVAMMAKIAINSFLAVKVSFFNELYRQLPYVFSLEDGSKEHTAAWENLRGLLHDDTRIGETHTQVPGPDGKLGFGGKCFPKDLRAFYEMTIDSRKDSRIALAALSVNKVVRPQG